MNLKLFQVLQSHEFVVTKPAETLFLFFLNHSHTSVGPQVNHIVTNVYFTFYGYMVSCFRVSGQSGSFGEMLLLVAIHFHSNQTHAIADLVCSTLGMKVGLGGKHT